MSIRFNCRACQTVLKIAEVVTEQRKVRCTSCGVVILLTPDEDAGDGMTVSIPDQMPKTKKDAGPQVNQWMILGGVGVAVLLVFLGLWWFLSATNERGAIEGDVTLDTMTLQRGTIRFIPIDNPKATIVLVPIVQGRISASASQGPFVGKNRWEITGNDNERVGKRYNLEQKETIDIKTGVNTLKFDVKSK